MLGDNERMLGIRNGAAITVDTGITSLVPGGLIVAPKQAADLCAGITAATACAFGLLPPLHAAPGNGGWVETTSPDEIVQLHVQSNVSVPVATQTAVQVAHV